MNRKLKILLLLYWWGTIGVDGPYILSELGGIILNESTGQGIKPN